MRRLDEALHIVQGKDFEWMLGDRYFVKITIYVQKLATKGELPPRFKYPSCYFREFCESDSEEGSEGTNVTDK
ncbi:hypothetical protein MA16_Dca019540 [Dendrobium catenatum]|uniref:Uncharacterized protein n=1 Tax=Dendrobium catenatum TaxID=906689 RepID=A0A2I0WKX4_9ASPA|nr:hypothetical protein MA16_Dca019540 [Dendrobium catenatum]